MNLKKRGFFILSVAALCMLLLGGFLFKLQTDLSLEQVHSDIDKKVAQIPTLYADAQATGAQVTTSYDEVYQGKANALALMAARTEELTPAAMQTYRELLNVDNVLLLDRSGAITNSAVTSPADFTRARYNRLREAFSGQVPAPFEVNYLSGLTFRYYAAQVDSTHIAVIEQSPAELNGLLADTATWSSVLSKVNVGLSGFAFAVSGRSYNFVYYPDEALTDKDATGNGVSVAQLEDGNYCRMTLQGKSYYCGVADVDDTYVICAVPETEVLASRNLTVLIILCAFFFVISLVIAYALLLMRSEYGKEADVQKVGPLYYDRKVGRRIGCTALVGLVCIMVISLYMQTLYSLSRYSLSNNQRVAEVEQSIEWYRQDQELVSTQYNRRYINKAKSVAYILSTWPELQSREHLETLSQALNLEWVTVFNNSGTSTVTNSPYGTFHLSTDPADQSYEFRKLLNGAPSVLQSATKDELTGAYHQYIGYQMLDESGNTTGFVQISVEPSLLEKALGSTSISSILDNITVGNAGFAFAVNKDDRTFAYFPGDKLTGRSAVDYGIPEAALSDSYCDYLTVDETEYYASSLETDNYFVFVVVPAGEVLETRWPVTLSTALFSAVCLLIIFLLLTLRRHPEIEDEKATSGQTNRNSANIDVTLSDGTVKKTQAVSSRWSNQRIAWNDKTPEQQVAALLKLFVSVFAVALCFALFFKGTFFDENSILYYIVAGKWQRGINIFSLTASLLLICVIAVLTMLARQLLKTMGAAMDTRGDTICRLLRSFLKYISVLVSLYYCLAMFGVDTSTLLASAGILSLVIGLGANTLVSDIIAGLFIIFEGEFRVGDIVTIGGWRGTVQEIGVRTTKIEDGSKNVKIISNRDVNGIINMTRKFSFAVCNVGIEYGESLERVENVLAKELPLFKKRLPAIKTGPFYKGVVELGDNSVNIRIVAECVENDRFQLERDLNREIKLLFDRNNINIPFPQVVVNQPSTFDENGATALEKRRAEAFSKQQANLSKDIRVGEGN